MAARTSLLSSAASKQLSQYLELTKPGITLFVACSAVAGYMVTALDGFHALGALLVLVATLAMSGGAATLNQVAECDRDKMMRRTARRPLASGLVRVEHARLWAWTLSAFGLTLALLTLPPLTALFLVLSHISYVNIYTPLKLRTPLCTLAGAFPGALPVLAGAAAGGHGITIAAAALTGLLFAWQLPHFMAIGWLAREDYARANYAMLFVVEPSGQKSGGVALMYAAATGACALLLAAAAPVGMLFTSMAVAGGLAYTVLAWRFMQQRDVARARRLFFFSLLVLPLLLCALAFELLVLA